MSKTILIIGDSWGVPNYEGPKAGDVPTAHTEYRLRDLGYTVYNCAINGGHISLSTSLARDYLSGKECTLEPRNLIHFPELNNKPTTIDDIDPKIDWIVWFHTECLRADHNPNWSLQENVEHGYRRDYYIVKQFLDELKCKIAVIGGQSPVKTDILKNYINPDFIIEDWRSEIIGKKLPEVHWITHSFWIDRSNDNVENKLKYTNMSITVMDAMKEHPDFIDNCHPAGIPHMNLTNRLHQIFQ